MSHVITIVTVIITELHDTEKDIEGSEINSMV